jgi:hypothetical protein
MSDYPGLVNKERAANLIVEVQDASSRNAIQLLINGVERFFREQPSQLRSPFDLAFFVEVLKDRIELARHTMNGTAGVMCWGEGEDEDFTRTYPVLDPAADIEASGIRLHQASNYVAMCHDRRLQETLLTFINGVFVRQRPKARLLSGQPMVVIIPDYPFDYLFMAMAVDYALRPGQPARIALESGEQE